VPPEEQFWKRYSAHHEFPLSTASSILLHALVFTVLIVGWAILSHYGLLGGTPKPEIGALEMSPGGGDGGQPDGIDGPRTGVDTRKESVAQPTTPVDPNRTEIPKQEIKPVEGVPSKIIPDAKNPEDFLPFEGNVYQEMKVKSDALRQKVERALGQAAKGTGGYGDGGNPGTGKGTVGGAGVGNEKGAITKRQRRQQRWIMIFNTRDGEDYARQLNGLKAILAIPVPGEEGMYEVIDDLRKGSVRPVKKGIGDIKRIYWIDDTPESVGSLSRALGLPNSPSYIVAFFPEELEQELLEKELKYGKLPEDGIEETRFIVRRKRNGDYEPQVESQKALRRR
jgi:hypothetical protein